MVGKKAALPLKMAGSPVTLTCEHLAMLKTAIEASPATAYAHACGISGFERLLFISGQVPADKDGNVPADYKSQYRLAWANVESRLAAAGMSFDNLVKVTIYLSDRRYVKESAGLRHEVIGDRTPAITIIITGIYDEAWLLEIEAIAAA
jgi:2-iminobutanoate/2-iminopropanoate deaminase